MTLLKIFSKLIILVSIAYLPAVAKSSEMRSLAKRDTVVIVPKTAWKTQGARPYKQHRTVKITVHHEGGKVLTVPDDARQRLKNIQSWDMGPDPKWADVPYPCTKYGISPTEISSHRDQSKQITCPGEYIYSYFKSGYIVDEVSKVLKVK